MRGFITLLTHYWFSYLLTFVVMVAIAINDLDMATAVVGSAVYALFFAVIPVGIAEFVDGLLPPEAPKTRRSPDPKHPYS